MRRTLLAFVLATLPLSGLAQEAAPAPAAAPAPRVARLVGVILSSAQALLWDDERGEYVLHRVGDDAFGGRLVELDADHVVIERGEAREVMELTAPPQMRVAGRRAPKRLPAMVISAAPERDAVAAAPVAAAPVPTAAPVAAAPAVAPAPVAAPVAAPAPAFVAAAPSTDIGIAPAPAAPAAVAPAPVAAPAVVAPTPALAPAPAAVPAVAATPPAPVVAPALPPPAATTVVSPPATPPVATSVTPSTPATAPVAAAASPDRRTVTAMLVPRADLNRALGDFAALSQDVQVAQQPEGGFRLAAVRPGSFFDGSACAPTTSSCASTAARSTASTTPRPPTPGCA